MTDVIDDMYNAEKHWRHKDRPDVADKIHEAIKLYFEGKAEKENKYICSVKGCEEPALDQMPYEQPSVCAKHDPGR